MEMGKDPFLEAGIDWFKNVSNVWNTYPID